MWLALVADQLQPSEQLAELLTERMSGLGMEATIAVATTSEGARSFALLADGRVMLPTQLRDLERAAHRSLFGVLTEPMYNLIATASPDDEVDGIVFISGPYLEPELPFDGADVAVDTAEFVAWIQGFRAQQRETIAAAKGPFLDWLAGRGGMILSDPSNLPMVAFRVRADLLQDPWLLIEPSIAQVDIQPSDQDSEELLGYAGAGSLGFSTLSGGACGGQCSGGGLAIGIWEAETAYSDYNPGIANENDRLYPRAAVYMHTPAFCTTNNDCPVLVSGNQQRCAPARVAGHAPGTKFCVQEHLTHVAASMGMRGSYTYMAGERGVSEQSLPEFGTWNIWPHVANQNDMAGFNWLMDESVTMVNRSVSNASGNIVSASIDFAARHNLALTTTASGNSPNQQVVCAGWNSLCVGGYAYNTWSNSSTHEVYSLSSYLNSTSHGERPHLLGPAIHAMGSGLHLPDIREVDSSMLKFGLNDIPIHGTSFAAPAVLALAHQAHQYKGWFSAIAHPIMKKAVLMAASVDSNQDGQLPGGNTWNAVGIDAVDGAGHPVGGRIKAILDANNYGYHTLYDSSFASCGPSCREYTAANVSVPGGGKLKVALVWNSCVTTPFGPSAMANDLDLVIVRPIEGPCNGGLTQSVSTNTDVEMTYDSCNLGKASRVFSIRVRIKNGATLAPCGSSNFENVALAWSVIGAQLN